MPRHFTHLPFTCYDSKMNPVEHVSHYNQLMTLYSQNDDLLCKVFPSNLGPKAIRWFNSLRKSSIYNFEELIQLFRARFVTCSQVPPPIMPCCL